MKITWSILALLVCLSAPAQPVDAPSSPRKLTAPKVRTNSTVKLQWDAVPDVQGYRIYYGPAPKFYTNSIGTPSTTLSVSNIVSRSAYYFAATAIGVNGLESAYSAEVNNILWSNQVVWVVVQVTTNIDEGWNTLPIAPIFIATNPPGEQLFRLLIQRTNMP